MKLAFNVGNIIVMLNADQRKVWVVYTQEQYHAIDRLHGPFYWRDDLQLPTQALLQPEPPVQQLEGFVADLFILAITSSYQSMEPAQQFRRRLAVGDIRSVNWRQSGSVAMVVCGHMNSKVFFAIVFTLPQLQKLQQQYFPHQGWRVQAFNSMAKLLPVSNYDAFVLEGDCAVQCIQACHVARLLG